jgi:hypothetical protein
MGVELASQTSGEEEILLLLCKRAAEAKSIIFTKE